MSTGAIAGTWRRWCCGWLAGKQDGKGVQAMPDGSRYDGEWKEGQPNGHGEMRNPSGETLTGEWKEGAFMGAREQK